MYGIVYISIGVFKYKCHMVKIPNIVCFECESAQCEGVDGGTEGEIKN